MYGDQCGEFVWGYRGFKGYNDQSSPTTNLKKQCYSVDKNLLQVSLVMVIGLSGVQFRE